MKRSIISTVFCGTMFAFLVLGNTSCKKDFGNYNTDPSIVTTPDISSLFAYSLERLESYQLDEWTWENLEQLLRFTQHITGDPYELSTNINKRYGVYYNDILPNLFAIREAIDKKADKDRYKNIKAATYIIQVLHGLKVTDLNGSIPYTEAIKARTEGKLNPVYDAQKVLFDTWLSQLTEAVNTLTGSTNQASFGSADFYYNNDWAKWAKLANTLKLRIAVRYERQDVNVAKNVFKEVMQSSAGPIDNDNAQFAYTRPDYDFLNTGVDYRSPRFGTSSIINFLKSTNDPRLKIYFNSNDLVGSFKDTLSKYSKSLPAFININDPLIMYQGGPADWTTDPAVAAWYKTTYDVGPNKWKLIGNINKKFFAPRINNANGTFTDYMVTHAEACFYIAEFIQKGYGTGFDTKGTAEDWYKKGIVSSIKTMNTIAETAQSTTGYNGNGDSEIQSYLNHPLIKLDGANNLERIYIQQYLNFFRLGTEAFVFCRRTGYPRNNSGYYMRNTWNEPIPRRYWLDEPPLGTNNANWQAAQIEQGFTPGDRSMPVLSAQKLWYDKNAPDFGEGN